MLQHDQECYENTTTKQVRRTLIKHYKCVLIEETQENTANHKFAETHRILRKNTHRRIIRKHYELELVVENINILIINSFRDNLTNSGTT